MKNQANANKSTSHIHVYLRPNNNNNNPIFHLYNCNYKYGITYVITRVSLHLFLS